MRQQKFETHAKTFIKENLIAQLYKPVEDDLYKQLKAIVLRNAMSAGHSHLSFNYKGEDYSIESSPTPRKRNRLLAGFQPCMDAYLATVKDLNNTEKPYVIGYINQVLNSSNSLTDYLALIPECLHKPVNELMSYCPISPSELSQDKIDEIKSKNIQSISLMKSRMVLNLLL